MVRAGERKEIRRDGESEKGGVGEEIMCERVRRAGLEKRNKERERQTERWEGGGEKRNKERQR